MSLLDQIKADIEQITSNTDEFAREIIFTAPDDTEVTVKGLHTKIHFAIDTDGNPVNSKKGHVSVSEKALTDLSYPVRNAAGEVDLRGHKVQVIDSTGTVPTYKIREWFPDESIGLIVCILEDYE